MVGQINPRHAFLYSNGAMTDLGTLGGDFSFARRINASGQVVGSSNVAAGALEHAFLYSNGAMTDLGTLGGAWSAADGINDSGQVVGDFSYTAADPQYPFLYSNGAMTDLNSLIAPGSGWVLGSATGINDAGQIVGSGTHNGQSHAFLLNLNAVWSGQGANALWSNGDNWRGGSPPRSRR